MAESRKSRNAKYRDEIPQHGEFYHAGMGLGPRVLGSVLCRSWGSIEGACMREYGGVQGGKRTSEAAVLGQRMVSCCALFGHAIYRYRCMYTSQAVDVLFVK